MKFFKAANILFITLILVKSTDKSHSEDKINTKRLSRLSEIYETSGKKGKLYSAIKWIMHFTCYEEDRQEIKKKVLSCTKKLLNAEDITQMQKEALESIVEKIEKGRNLHDFTQNEFDFIFLIYYHINHFTTRYDISKALNQEKLNKNRFENILKSKANITTLYLNYNSTYDINFSDLIKAMSRNIERVIVSQPSNLEILNIFKIFKESIKQNISLFLLDFVFDQYYTQEILDLLAKFKMTSFSVIRCDFSTICSGFLEPLKNNENLVRLNIKDMELSEEDVNSIINVLNSSITPLKILNLEELEISEKLLEKLFKEFKNNKKLQLFAIINDKSEYENGDTNGFEGNVDNDLENNGHQENNHNNHSNNLEDGLQSNFSCICSNTNSSCSDLHSFQIFNIFILKDNTNMDTPYFFNPSNKKTIKKFYIKNMGISEDEIYFIINILNRNSPSHIILEELQVNSELLGKLIEEISKSIKIEKFELINCNIDSKTVNSVINLFKNKNSIKDLAIISNDICSEHIKDITEGLKKNTRMSKFKFHSKRLDIKDFTLILKGILEKNFKIEELEFDCNLRIFESADGKDKKIFKELVKKIKEKRINFKCNWPIICNEQEK